MTGVGDGGCNRWRTQQAVRHAMRATGGMTDGVTDSMGTTMAWARGVTHDMGDRGTTHSTGNKGCNV